MSEWFWFWIMKAVAEMAVGVSIFLLICLGYLVFIWFLTRGNK